MTNSNPPQVFLASQSPRRRELLKQIGVPHQVISVDVPEIHQVHETPLAYVQRLAREKAAAGFAQLATSRTDDFLVLGADTLGLLDGEILEKPLNKADSMAMLMRMSGKTHQVLSAVAVHSRGVQACRVSITDVCLRALTPNEIEAYWATGEPCDKAGSYAIQGLGAVFVQSINGSYSGVVGLPLEITCELLAMAGASWWQAAKDINP